MWRRVRWLVPSVAALCVVALTACGPASPAPSSSQPAAPAAPAQSAPAAPAQKPAEPAKPAAEPAKPAAEKPAPQPAKPSGEASRILIGTTNSTSSHYSYYAAVAKVINAKVPSVNATIVETGASVENTNRMGKGEFDMGLTTGDVYYRAYHGIGAWKDKPITELRWLWLYNLNQHALIVREDSGIKTLEELNGKDFNPCFRGAACEQMSKDALEALGIKPKWFTASLADAVQAVKDRRIVGYGKPMAGKDVIDATMIELMATTKIRVLGFSEEQAKKVMAAHPYYSFTMIGANVFKDQEWNKDPIRTMGIVLGTGGTSRMPEDTAYKIVKAIIEDNGPNGEGVQAAAFPGVKGWDFAKLTVEEGLLASPPLHAGAVKYYKEIGKKVPDNLIPPEAK